MAWETRQEDIDDYSIALALLLNLVSSAHPPHSRPNSLLVSRVLLFYAVNPLMWSLILRFINVSPLTYCMYPSTIGRLDPSLSVSYWSNVVRFSFSDAKTFFSCWIFFHCWPSALRTVYACVQGENWKCLSTHYHPCSLLSWAGHHRTITISWYLLVLTLRRLRTKINQTSFYYKQHESDTDDRWHLPFVQFLKG